MTLETITPIRSTVIHGIIVFRNIQAFDGFLITIMDGEFAGRYEFTYDYDEKSAYEAIYNFDAEPE